MTTVVGKLKSDASTVGGSVIVFLQPWSNLTDHSEAPLRVVIEVPEARRKTLVPRLTKGTAVRVLVVGEVQPPKGVPWWTANASELDVTEPAPAEAEVVVVDEVLGRLEFDRRIGAFVGARESGGVRFTLNVELSGRKEASPDADVAAAREPVARFETALDAVGEAVATRLLPLFNGTWREEGERVITAQEFRARIKLSSLRVHPDGTALAYFDDGGLFADHSIEVFLDDAMNVTEATLAG